MPAPILQPPKNVSRYFAFCTISCMVQRTSRRHVAVPNLWSIIEFTPRIRHSFLPYPYSPSNPLASPSHSYTLATNLRMQRHPDRLQTRVHYPVNVQEGISSARCSTCITSVTASLAFCTANISCQDVSCQDGTSESKVLNLGSPGGEAMVKDLHF